MADTFTQIHIQIIFAVKYWHVLLSPEWKSELHRYITGMVQSDGHKMLAVNSVSDHIHMLIGMRPHVALSEMVREIKFATTSLIGRNFRTSRRFRWQEGYGAFSYSRSQVPNVIRYILHQEEHHARKTFRQEYLGLLTAFDTEISGKMLFEWISDK
jgi:putative transposase